MDWLPRPRGQQRWIGWPLGSFLMAEIIDNWTVAQAWEHVHGRTPRPEPEDILERNLSEIDAVVASYFDDESLEGRKRAAAALAYLHPRLIGCPLHPGPDDRRRQHVAAIATLAVKTYCQQDSIPATGYRHLSRCLRRWDLRGLDDADWFLIWDSLGTSGKNVTDTLVWDFYKFAGQHVRYSKW